MPDMRFDRTSENDPEKDKDLRQQRDRFVAFSFASSDLFLEVDEHDRISYALGAGRGLLGVEDKDLTGMNWLDVFAPIDRPTVVAMRSRAKPVKRCGPILVKLDESLGESKSVIITGIRMPQSETFYVTLAHTSILTARAGMTQREIEERELLDRDSFINVAREALNTARSIGTDVDLTLLDLGDTETARETWGEDRWQAMTETITGFLRSKSVDGNTAAEITEGRYSIVHDREIDGEYLREQIEVLSQETDPDGHGLRIAGKTVTSDLASLSDREATKALIYTINEFERKGTALNIQTLNSGFKAYVSANAQKITQFKSIIKQLSFNLHFQPIVNMQNYEAAHFEMLTRFSGDGSTAEWIAFGEDIGLASEFDMAVVERVLNYLLYKSPGRRSKFAVNISGQSIQSDIFCDDFYRKMKTNAETLSERLIFEITESSMIENLDMVNNQILALQRLGYKICLDDFGAGAASFQYLQRLHVDYVKIDGSYTRRLIKSERDSAMIKNLIRMCHDLNVKTVVEMIEEADQAYMLKHMGADYGQGYLFSPARPKPEYTPPKNLHFKE